MIIFAFGMPWLNMWVGKSVWWDTLSFPSRIGFYPTTVAAFQKMKRIQNRGKLRDGHPHIFTVSSTVTLVPLIFCAFPVDGDLKFRVSSVLVQFIFCRFPQINLFMKCFLKHTESYLEKWPVSHLLTTSSPGFCRLSTCAHLCPPVPLPLPARGDHECSFLSLAWILQFAFSLPVKFHRFIHSLHPSSFHKSSGCL